MISIIPYFWSVHWEWGEQAGSEGSKPWPNRGGGHPKTCPHRWWGPQNILLNVHYPLPLLGPLGVRGASLGPTEVVATPKLAPTGGGNLKTYPLISITSYLCSVHWDWGEQALAQQRWWAPQNLPPQVVGTPKHTPQSPLPPTSAQSIGTEGSKLGVRGASLGPTEVVATSKLAPTGGGDPKTYPSISITPYLHSFHWEWGSKLGVRGASLGPTEVVATPKLAPTGGGDPKKYPLISITSYLCSVHWEWGEQAGSEGSKPWPNRGGGHPKTCPHRWWGPQNIPLDLHYPLLLIGPLGVRGASWEWGEQALAQQRWWPPQNLPPQVVGTPKHTPQCPLPPTSAQSIGSKGSKPWPNRGCGHPKTCPHRWWEPQNIPLDLHYLLPLLSPLGLRGASLGPTEVVGTSKLAPTGCRDPKTYPSISITPYLCSVHWDWGGQAGSEGSEPWTNRGGGHLKTCPHKWWGPQNIPLNLHYSLPPLIPLGVRGASWEWGEQALAQQRWWPLQNLPPQVVGTRKNIPWSPLLPTSAQSIGSEGSKLEVRGASLGPTEVVATPKLAPTGGGVPKTYPLISITPYFWSVHWEWGEQAGSEGSKPWPNRGGGHPKTCPHRWWGPQNILLNVHYPLPLLSPLGVRGASLGPTEVVGTSKLAHKGGGDPKS